MILHDSNLACSISTFLQHWDDFLSTCCQSETLLCEEFGCLVSSAGKRSPQQKQNKKTRCLICRWQVFLKWIYFFWLCQLLTTLRNPQPAGTLIQILPWRWGREKKKTGMFVNGLFLVSAWPHILAPTLICLQFASYFSTPCCSGPLFTQQPTNHLAAPFISQLAACQLIGKLLVCFLNVVVLLIIHTFSRPLVFLASNLTLCWWTQR